MKLVDYLASKAAGDQVIDELQLSKKGYVLNTKTGNMENAKTKAINGQSTAPTPSAPIVKRLDKASTASLIDESPRRSSQTQSLRSR